jgi:hypothetical protein
VLRDLHSGEGAVRKGGLHGGCSGSRIGERSCDSPVDNMMAEQAPFIPRLTERATGWVSAWLHELAELGMRMWQWAPHEGYTGEAFVSCYYLCYAGKGRSDKFTLR